MSKTHHTASLLPLLDDRNPFYLEIDIVAADTGRPDKVVAPFSVLDDTDPMFQLIGAKIMTPLKSTIQSVCLMVQKDQIQNNHERFQRLQNKTVVQAWQSTFDFYTTTHQPTRPILHRAHISDNGTLLPMSPLYYCQFKKRYFHPPCPECSQQLQLCVDDDLLQENGLQPYTTSLSRYLYCQTCCQRDASVTFYVPSRHGHPQKCVKDLSQLLARFGSISYNNDMGMATIPCNKCDEIDACYHTGKMAIKRIIPFRFYPFFMLMFPARIVNASESLRLMSGASVAQQTLSQVRSASAIPPPKRPSTEKSPQIILRHILEKWKKSVATEFVPDEPPSAPIHKQYETQKGTIDEQEKASDIYETVIISADQFENKQSVYAQRGAHDTKPCPETADPGPPGEFETPDDLKDIETRQTIIVPTNGLNQESSSAGDLDEVFPKTIIQKPSQES